jgi:hypothetical protein
MSMPRLEAQKDGGRKHRKCSVAQKPEGAFDPQTKQAAPQVKSYG